MSNEKQPRTIPEIFFNRVQRSGDEDAVTSKKGGRWQSKTWDELAQEVRTLARGVSDWVQPKDIVCLLSENRPEWWIADLAIQGLGGASAPIYATNPAKDIAYILNDSGAKLLFVSTEEQLTKIKELKKANKLTTLERVVVFDEITPDEDWVFTLAQVQEQNASASDPIDARMPNIAEDDLATLIYTSGTTGEPKGVMLTHRNLVTNCVGARAVLDGMSFPGGEKVLLSFLPLSHSLERTVGYYVALDYGCRVAFAESVEKLVENMGEIRPTMLVSVPRIYEKVYSKVMQGATGLKGKLVHWALRVGKEHAKYRLANEVPPGSLAFKYALATKLVFSKIHARLGGRLWNAISGGAPLAVEVAEFLGAVGLSVYEGYGLTETSPIITGNKPGQMRLGSVGTPWPNVEIAIEPDPERDGEDGEIVVKGPNVMKGYFNKPEATAEVIGEGGWLRTGDIGHVDNQGYLFITDRKKELIKTAGGKYVAPQPIENNLKAHPLVEQAVVVGDRRKYCVALIVPCFEALENALGEPLPSQKEMVNEHKSALALYQALIDKANEGLGSWEQLKRFALLPAEMTQETGELTPTLKVKRRVVDEKYKAVIDGLY